MNASMILNGLKAEFLKSRHTKLYWMLWAAPLFITICVFFIGKNISIEVFQGKGSPWNGLNELTLSLFGFNIMMMAVITLISLTAQIEHKANAWKHLLTLPVPQWTIYASKYLFMLLIIALVHLASLGLLVVNGSLLMWVRPELGFTFANLPLANLVWNFFLLYLSVMCVTAFQFWFSLRVKNYILPLFMGLFIVMVATFAALFGWSKSVYIPYSYAALILKLAQGTLNEPQYYGLARFLWISLAGFFTISLAMFWDMTRRRIKG